jgi:mannose-6-phosphate isomerase
MANSDNVLRGGLTSKHVDLPELMNILDFKPLKPAIIRPPEKTGGEEAAFSFVYPSPCDEFSLAVYRSRGGEISFGGGPAICVVTGGSLEIAPAGARADSAPPPVILKQGESVFIPAAEKGKLLFRGDYTAYSASIPQNQAHGPAGRAGRSAGPAEP